MSLRHRLPAGLLAMTLLLPAGLCAARADTISAMPDEDGKTIAYTPCQPGEDAAECIVYMITCQPNGVFGTGLELSVVGQGSAEQPDILAIARAFLDKPYGEKKLGFTVGGKIVEIPVSAVIVSANELNGDWDVSIRSMDDGAFYGALNDGSSTMVSVAAGGFTARLADNKSEGKALMAFKKACLQ